MDVIGSMGGWIPQSVALSLIAVLLTALFAIIRWNFAQMLLRFTKMESTIDTLSKNIDTELNEVKIAQAKFVTIDDMRDTVNNLHEKTNKINERLAVLEAKHV